jgi:hypothetical protein
VHNGYKNIPDVSPRLGNSLWTPRSPSTAGLRFVELEVTPFGLRTGPDGQV